MAYCVLSSFTPADIVFIVKDKPHPVFKRDNDNLVYTATVPLGKVTQHIHHSLHPNTSMFNLHTVLYTFPKVLTWGICEMNPELC